MKLVLSFAFSLVLGVNFATAGMATKTVSKAALTKASVPADDCPAEATKCELGDKRVCCDKKNPVCANNGAIPYCIEKAPECKPNEVLCHGLPRPQCCAKYPTVPNPCAVLFDGGNGCLDDKDKFDSCGKGEFLCAVDEPFATTCCKQGKQTCGKDGDKKPICVDLPDCGKGTACGLYVHVPNTGTVRPSFCCAPGDSCSPVPNESPYTQCQSTKKVPACPKDRPTVCDGPSGYACCAADEECAAYVRSPDSPQYCSKKPK